LTLLTELLAQLHSPEVRALAWTIGSASLFSAEHPAWGGRLRNDAWAEAELERRAESLLALDRRPQPLQDALGDPRAEVPLGHTFEKLVLFWQQMRTEVRTATRGLTVRRGGRTLGEFDIVLLRQDGVIETLEVTVKFYLNLNPALGIDGIIGPRAFDRMAEKWRKMTGRQIALGASLEGRLAIAQWLESTCAESSEPERLQVENAAISRGYLFHPWGAERFPPEISAGHLRGHWWTDREPQPAGIWRALTGWEWLGPYRGALSERDWPVDPRMPKLVARLHVQACDVGEELARAFIVRADSGLFRSAGLVTQA
jgi:Uncharacterized protein conserved in bacteria